MIYSITTEQRTYSQIRSLEHLIEVRRNWDDWTPTKLVYLWAGSVYQWVKINPEQMVEAG